MNNPKEIDEHFNTHLYLNSKNEGILRAYYGNPTDIKIDEDIKSPVSPDVSIKRAGEHVLKMESKGYFSISDEIKDPIDVYKRTRYAQKETEKYEKKSPSTLSTQLTSSQATYQKTWLSSNVVVNTVQEMRNMEFKDQYDRFDIEQKFMDFVTSIIRRMKNEGKLEEQRQTKHQRYAIMRTFVEKTVKMRKNIIRQFIKENKIVIEKLTESQKDEFNDVLPEIYQKKPLIDPKARKGEKIEETAETNTAEINTVDLNFVNNINQMSKKLPKLYQFSDFCVDDRTKKVTAKKFQSGLKATSTALTNAMTKPLTKTLSNVTIPSMSDLGIPELCQDKQPTNRPKTNSKRKVNVISSPNLRHSVSHDAIPKVPDMCFNKKYKISRNDINRMFWKDNDPLEKERKGKYVDQLDTITKFAANIPSEHDRFGEDIEMPFHLADEKALPITPNNNNNNNYRLGDSLFFRTSARVQTASESSFDFGNEEDSIINLKSSKANLKNNNDAEETEQQSGTAYQFRTETQIMRFLDDQSQEMLQDDFGEVVYKKLEKIWDQLGFTIFQKLDMVVKYSKDAEESNKLSDVLQLWESSWSFVERYNNAYYNLKEYLKFNAAKDARKVVVTIEMNDDLKQKEKLLISVAEKLHCTFDDDLTFKRKSVHILIADRRVKIKMLCLQADIDYDDL